MKKLVMTMAMGVVLLAGVYGDSLVDVYKTGRLTIKPDPSFGQNTDWSKLLANSSNPDDPGFRHTRLAVTTNGTIFLLKTTSYQIYKINQKGELMLSFGKKGYGPGEFPSQPDALTVLDERYVLASDVSLGIINVYDLNGQFIKKLKLEFGIHEMIPLKNNKIAVLGLVTMGGMGYKRLVLILDVETGKETVVASITCNGDDIVMVKKENSSSRFGLSVPWRQAYLFIASSKEGNLIYARSDKPEAVIFSPEGARLGQLSLNVTTSPIDEEEKEEFRQSVQKAASKLNLSEKTLEVMKRPGFLDGNTPYFTKLMTDSDGNVLVFKYTKDKSRRFLVYQVNDSTGKFAGEVSVDFGPLGSADNLGPMVFHQGSLYVLGNLKSAAAEDSRLIRVLLVNSAK